MDVREYIDTAGRAPFARWFDQLEANATSITALATGYILVRTGIALSFCLAAGQKNASKTISRTPKFCGRTTNDGKNWRL